MMNPMGITLKDMKHDEEVEQIKNEFERKELLKRIYQNFCCCFPSQNIDLETREYRLTELKEKERKLESLEQDIRKTIN